MINGYALGQLGTMIGGNMEWWGLWKTSQHMPHLRGAAPVGCCAGLWVHSVHGGGGVLFNQNFYVKSLNLKIPPHLFFGEESLVY